MKGVLNYAFSTLLELPYGDAADQAQGALKEGSEVLTEIDIELTLKTDLDTRFFSLLQCDRSRKG